MVKVLLTDPLPQGFFAQLQRAFPPGASLTMVATLDDAAFAHAAADADIVLVVDRPLTAALLAHAPRVRLIQRLGIG